MKRKDGYAPIESYAAIGDGRTTALVARDGSIDFLSLPAMHCPTTFGALLDPDKGGRFVLQPAGRFESERRYLDRSNVLETTYRTKTGVVRVTEALALRDGALLPWLEISRRVEGLSGETEMRWSVEPRFAGGRSSRASRGAAARRSPKARGLALGVHSFDAGEPEPRAVAIAGGFTARAGSSSLLTVCCTESQPIPVPLRDDAERRLDGTIESWRRWLGAWDYDGPWEGPIARSALALKLLVYAPRGAIVAAPTTSLPERIGGDKNYDYRYMWVRDASFTLEAFLRLGLPEQVHESFSCLLESVRTTAPDIHPFYTAEGEIAHRCDELPLAGYRGSRPVRHGNAASRQLQLGSWGDLLEMTDLYVRNGNALDEATASMLAGCLDRLCRELGRRGLRHLGAGRPPAVHELAPRGLDGLRARHRAGRERRAAGGAPGPLARRARARHRLRRGAVLVGRGGAMSRRAARRASTRPSSAARGWAGIASTPTRFARSVDAIRAALDAGGGLLYRTTREAGNEGAFVACSFWLVEALARSGRVDEAARSSRSCSATRTTSASCRADRPADGSFLGNFPQGLSHLALVNAAGAIRDARGAGASATARAAAR